MACCVCIIDNYNPTSAILKGLQIFHCQLHYKSTVRRVLTLSGYGSVRNIPSVFNIWQRHLNIQVGSPILSYSCDFGWLGTISLELFFYFLHTLLSTFNSAYIVIHSIYIKRIYLATTMLKLMSVFL